MTNKTRMIHKITEEDTKGRRSSARLAGASVSGVEDSSGLRRSSREKTSNKMASPENRTPRKSERLEKQSPSAPSITKKSLKKRLERSPLRRSERCRKQCSSLSSTGSKNSGKTSGTPVSDPEKIKEGRKRSSMKKSTQRAKEACRVESEDTESAQTEKACMDAHAYRALFRKQGKKVKLSGNAHHSSSKIDFDGQSRITVLAIGNSSACPTHYEEFSSPRKFPAEDCPNSESHNSKELDAMENCQENFSLISNKLSFADQIDNPENASNLESSVNQDFKSLPSPRQRVDSITNGRSSRGDGCTDMGPEVVADASTAVNCEDNIPAPLLSISSDNICVEKDGTNLKRKSGELDANVNSRVGENLTKKELQSDQPLEIQADGEDTICFTCKLGGFLLYCHGKDCKRGFHLSCLNPPLKDAQLGVWYCPTCDVREMEASDANGVRVQKQFIVSGCRSESSSFLEYWVPVQISNVQLEQYCSTLLSNSLSLRSSLKTDPVGALRDILFASRKCCDHPYLVDPSLQKLLIKDLPVVQYLDVGIKASGKLQLLDKLLSELQNRCLRALVLFQSIGNFGRDSVSIGDILDDLLRQRFGADSYERIDGDVPRHKKLAAMNNYNKKDLGRFVFLLEARACLPSIKLMSVDVVIIFGSDWNPANDIRNLQKVQLESQFEQIKLFRLYTSYTVEEKVLINAKNGDSVTMQNAPPNSTHSLLMWGAKHLFDKLEEFHQSYGLSSCKASCDQSQANDVLHELLSILSENDENRSQTKSCSSLLISRAQQGAQTYYSKEILLLGESKIRTHAEELPQLFWTKLLKGKAPDWKYSSVSQQRNRKRVQINGNQYTEKDESNEVGKKRRKVAETNIDLHSRKQGKDEHKQAAASKEAASGPVQLSSLEKGSVVASEGNLDGSDERRTLRVAQDRLHLILKPQISKLCEALSLEGEAKDMVYTFLNYVINNRVVNQEPATILQAFQLALCWTAASLVRWKIDHKESLALAKDRLYYGCSKDEAEGVYSILRGLKKPFLRHIENSKAVHTSKAPEKVNEISTEKNLSLSGNLVILPNKVKVEVEDWPLNQEPSDKDVIGSPILGERENLVCAQEIQGKCSEQMAKLLKEQEEERNKIYRNFEVEKGVLENEQSLEAFFVTQLHRDGSMRTEKLKALGDEYARKIKQCENQMNIHLKELEETHLVARNEVQQKEASSAGFLHQDQIDHVDSMSKSENQVGNGRTNDGEAAQQAHPSEAAAVSEEPAQCQCENGIMQENTDVQPPSSGDQLRGGPTLGAVIPDGVDTACEGGLNEVQSTCDHQEDSLDRPTSEVAEVVPDGADTAYEHGRDEVENSIPDGVDSAPKVSFKEVDNASEHREDPISPTSVGYQGISGQLVATPTTYHDAAIQPDQISNDQGHTSSLPHELHEENASQETIDMPPDSRSAQLSDQPCLVVSGTEAAVQLPCPPPNPQTADWMPHQCRRDEGLNTRNALNQFVPEPLIPSALQMATAPLGPLETGLTTRPPLLSATQIALPKCSDPLQNELERLLLESDLTTRIYEDTKSKLKADCEKEIEGMLAQIRGKYKMKIQDAEAQYSLKLNELQTNQNKVMMNKILAEAFQSKCMDLRASTALAVQQDAISSSAQLPSSSSQVSHQFVPRPSSSALLHDNNHAAISHPINQQGLQPMRPATSVQVMSSSASVCAPRLPITGQFPSPGNVQAQPEVRNPAPAPHLQPFRPSLSALPRGASPPPPPGYPSTPLTRFSPNSVTNIPFRSAQSSGIHQHDDFSGGPLVSLGSRGSALELLSSISRRPISNLHNSVQLPPLNLAGPGSSPEVRHPSTGNNNTAEVLCLSDDD